MTTLIEVIRDLQAGKDIKTIDLGYNKIGAEGAAALAKALETNKTVTSIQLRHNNIGAEGAAALAKALETNKTVTSIDLASNQIGAEGAAALAKALETNKTVTSIQLWHNNIGAEGAKALAKALETNKTVTSIDLRENNIGAEGAAALAKALETNKTVTSIDLASNQIGAEGAAALAKALETNKTVTSIDLASNQIGAEGAAALAKALETNKTVTSIDLRENNIGAEGAAALAKALEINKTVTSIDLRENNIGAEGAAALAKALEINKTVTSIQLWHNNIGAEGAKALAKALETNKTVTSIDLRYNNIGAEGAKALAKALETNKTVTKIDLRENNIGAELLNNVSKIIKQNKQNELQGIEALFNKIDFGIEAIQNKLFANQEMSQEEKKAVSGVLNKLHAGAKTLQKQQILSVGSAEEKTAFTQDQLLHDLVAGVIKDVKSSPQEISCLKDVTLDLAEQMNLDKAPTVKLMHQLSEDLVYLKAESPIKQTSSPDIQSPNIYSQIQDLQVKIKNAVETNNIIKDSHKQEMLARITNIIKLSERLSNIDDIKTLTEEMQRCIGGKITRGQVEDLEETARKLFEQQDELGNYPIQELFTVFNRTTEEMKSKVSNDQTTSVSDKQLMKDRITAITKLGSNLGNKDDLRIIIKEMQELLNGKITKGRLSDIDDLVETKLADQKTDSSAYAVAAINYDNELLNHPDIIKEAMQQYSFNKILLLSEGLDSSLLDEAVATNNSSLVLAGLLSLDHHEYNC